MVNDICLFLVILAVPNPPHLEDDLKQNRNVDTQ